VTGTRYWRRVYEGTIDGIFDNPPGIMLSSVQVWSATETYVLDPDGNEHFFPLTLIEPAFGSSRELIPYGLIDRISFLD
jgi:hypothetical protein